MDTSPALRITGLNKHFGNGRHALRDVNLEIAPGEMVALLGASGSGKSTLLRHVAGLVAADEGGVSRIEINGRCVQAGGRIQRDIRHIRSQVGFVFQQFNLVDRLPVLVNVLVGRLHQMPWWRGWVRWFNAQERALALEALSRVGIVDCHAQRASTLSGGQQQRAAIARTLVQGARVVLADERAGCAAPAGDWAAQLQAWARQVQVQLRHVSDRLGGFNFYLAKNPGFDMDARDRAMWDEFRGDYRAMAQKYGITEMRARQIIDAARREELARRQGRLDLDGNAPGDDQN